MARSPSCPVCAAESPGPADDFGVHRCPACAIEFRPPGRVPIRRAGLSPLVEAPPPSRADALRAGGLILVLLAIAFGYGTYQARQRTSAPRPGRAAPPSFEPPALELDFDHVLEPLAVPELDADALLTVPLRYETHVSQRRGSELFMTGLVHGQPGEPLEQVRVGVRWRDAAGLGGATIAAEVGCETVTAADPCPWMIDAELPGEAHELELIATAQRSLGLWEQVELRNDRPGELSFDPDAGELRVTLVGPALLGPWAAVTAYDARGRVLALARTEWPALGSGEHRLEVAVPRPAAEAARFAVRFAGRRSSLPDPILPPRAEP